MYICIYICICIYRSLLSLHRPTLARMHVNLFVQTHRGLFLSVWKSLFTSIEFSFHVHRSRFPRETRPLCI